MLFCTAGCACRIEIVSAEAPGMLGRMKSRILPVALLFALAHAASAGTLAQFRTHFGDIEIELYDHDKPVTVQNFLRYIQSGVYEDGFAHRLAPGFVVQGGGYWITNRFSTNWNVVPMPTFAPITNEFAVGPRLSNVFGTIAMAKLSGDTNSATSQWFINLANNSSLDAANSNNLFVVFGRVIQGTNILNRFNSFQYWSGTQTSNFVYQGYASPFNSLPLLKFTSTPSGLLLSDTNLVYIDVTLLQVSVETVGGGGKKISWNSATGLTNIVEYTTSFPPAWSTLITTNGTGARLAVVDNSGDTKRFYRVRVPR